MVKIYRLDLISFAISLALHFLLFLTLGFTEVFHTKTYQIVDILPLSFDVNVESKLVGERAKKGDPKISMTTGSFTEMPQGKVSEKKKTTQKKFSAQREGEYESTISNNPGYSSELTKVISSKTGKGRIALSFSMDNFRNKPNKKLPAISSSKVVPYLLKVKNRIISNWKNPYVSSRELSSEDTKVVIYVSINKKGKLDEINVEKLSSDMLFNRSAISAIYSSEPFDPIPEKVGLNKIRLRVEFELK
jgi:protein TonB